MFARMKASVVAATATTLGKNAEKLTASAARIADWKIDSSAPWTTMPPCVRTNCFQIARQAVTNGLTPSLRPLATSLS